jgi:uncharacterized membrane protein YadS
VFASLSLFSPTQLAAIDTAYSWLFSMAFVGLGSEIQLGKLRTTGLRPIVVVLLSLVFGSTVSLVVLMAVF